MRYHLRRRRVLGVVLFLLSLTAAPAALAQNPPEEIEYYATDALGSVRLVFTATGQVLGRSDYLPFGETLNQSGALPRQRFTGQERDGEAGMDYFNARNLLARTGRMNAPDPLFVGAVSNPQAWNRYVYVGNNPLGFVDPTGLTDQATAVLVPGGMKLPDSYVKWPSQETMSEAAREGSLDLLVGAYWNTLYQSMAGSSATSSAFFGQHPTPTDYTPKSTPPTEPPGKQPPVTGKTANSPTITASNGSSKKSSGGDTAGQTVFVAGSVGAYLFGGAQASAGAWCDGRGCGWFFSPGSGYGFGAGLSLQIGSVGLNRDGFRGAFMEVSGAVPGVSGTAYVTQSGEWVGAAVGTSGGYGGSVAFTYTTAKELFTWCVRYLGCR